MDTALLRWSAADDRLRARTAIHVWCQEVASTREREMCAAFGEEQEELRERHEEERARLKAEVLEEQERLRDEQDRLQDQYLSESSKMRLAYEERLGQEVVMGKDEAGRLREAVREAEEARNLSAEARQKAERREREILQAIGERASDAQRGASEARKECEDGYAGHCGQLQQAASRRRGQLDDLQQEIELLAAHMMGARSELAAKDEELKRVRKELLDKETEISDLVFVSSKVF